MLTAEQVRAARAALRMEQAALAREANISVETVKRLEAMDGELRARSETIQNIKIALERHGIEFLNEEYYEPGIRFAADGRMRQIRKEICDEVAGWVDARLKSLMDSDPMFLHHDSEYIVDNTLEGLSHLLVLSLPDIIKKAGSMMIPPAPPPPTSD